MSVIALALWGLLQTTAYSSGLSRTAAAAEKADLRRLRLQNNEAMAARDLNRTMDIVAEDYVIVAGNDTIRRSKRDMEERWSHSFADPQALPCVRRPSRFEVGEYNGIRRAAEAGAWECPMRKTQGLEHVFGRYSAHWSKSSGRWKVVSDNYVTLGCRGPGCERP